MVAEGSEVRVDDVDGRIWIETPGTEAAATQLHAVLDRGRQEPRPWLPFVVLCGENGTGKTALATRFIAQAQRAVACTLVDRLRRERDAPAKLSSPERLRREREKAEAEARDRDLLRRVRDFGHCPRVCAPAAFAPEEDLDRAIHAAMHGDGPRRVPYGEEWYRREVREANKVVPATMVSITRKPEASWLERFITGTLVNSPGDRSLDPLRRTSMLFVDGADRLLAVSDRERRTILQDIKDVPRPATVVLIGSQELACAVRAEGVTQTITVPTLEDGPVFDAVVRVIFGECGPDEARRLHAATGGAMGPLLHIAGLRGLRPPYAVPEEQVLRLPSPARDVGGP